MKLYFLFYVLLSLIVQMCSENNYGVRMGEFENIRKERIEASRETPRYVHTVDNETPAESFNSNYDAIDVSRLTAGDFVVCEDTNTYNNPIENILYLQGSLDKGEIVKIRELRYGQWALITVTPTIIEYVDMKYLKRVSVGCE